MATIRTLFDPSKDINRAIEKVISYAVSQEARLKAEISEYVVTDSIERQMEQLLEKMQSAMDAGGGHEVGVWVSGFYGSGKSSFTKYLGLAFDGHIQIDGQPFLKHLQNRLKRATTKALLNTVAARFPAAIVMLDLASEQIAGATLAEVSTVLYHKTLQHAGYSRNVKVAAFERKLKKDGRYAEFEAMFLTEVGVPWRELQNDELVVDSVLPGFAHRMYPTLFRSEQAFVTTTSDVIYLMNDRVREMIEVVRDFSSKDRIIFIIDEIGGYVGSNQNKILDLQGLAENLKNIGGGKVWIVGTAQQTLTEDDPRAAVNSPELFKLKDRFPITVDLESSDIREICYNRLLGKSPAGETLLGNLFDRHGAQLRHCAKLADAKSYDATLDRTSFINLYPFLPAHFDILLHLLGALAKSTGGIGLRSAIKVVQEILIEGAGRQDPVADRPVGWLATTVTLFDSLDRDIKRAFPQIHHAVDKVKLRVPDDDLTQSVAKTIAILQILNNLPSNVQNVAALMHPCADAESLADKVKGAVEGMLKDQFIPLMLKDGNLRFFSEKLTDIEQERGQIAVRTPDARRIFNAALREVFDPLPTAKIHGSLTVSAQAGPKRHPWPA
ncbi:MAG: BREX system P-loop protein BrxC [Rhodospirillaceae bacterium]